VSFCRPGYYLKVSLLLLVLLLPACATVKKAPLTGIVPGREVETLQSAISMSVKSGDHSTSGRGYLIFKAPDRFHMAVLSPFGLTVLELFLDKDRLTCLVPSRQSAYSGSISELPENSGLQGMSMMKWVVAKPAAAEVAGARQFTAPSGDRFVFDEHGLLERKVSPQGDQVQYQEYQNIDGVPFPLSLLMKNPYGATVKIIFDDPQINQPVEDSALVPNLEGYTVLPLAEFKGI
jgi:outer membrane biogenesis lipoprotein LolB